MATTQHPWDGREVEVPDEARVLLRAIWAAGYDARVTAEGSGYNLTTSGQYLQNLLGVVSGGGDPRRYWGLGLSCHLVEAAEVYGVGMDLWPDVVRGDYDPVAVLVVTVALPADQIEELTDTARFIAMVGGQPDPCDVGDEQEPPHGAEVIPFSLVRRNQPEA